MPFKSGKDWNGNRDGRPTRQREVLYLGILKEIADAKQWRALCQEAVLGARGKKVVVGKDEKPTAVDDPDSTPQSRLAYMRFLADYLIGKPIQPVIVDSGEGEVLDEYLQLREEELDVIIDAAKEKSDSILREARKLANRGVAKKSGRKARSGNNGAAGKAFDEKSLEADSE